MQRYYESEALIEFVKQNTPHMNGETTMKCVEFAIKNAPTADVVPKSEVAKKIFEDIWASIATHAFTTKSADYAGGAYDTIEWVDSKIAEVEKKYTEGE